MFRTLLLPIAITLLVKICAGFRARTDSHVKHLQQLRLMPQCQNLGDRKVSALYQMNEKYCLNVVLNIKPERREEFLDVIKTNQQGTLSSEKLCIQYTWGEDVSSPNTFYFHEAYETREGFEAHTSSSHFAVWQKFADSDPTPFTTPPEVVFFKTLTSDRLSWKLKLWRIWRTIIQNIKRSAIAAVKYNYLDAFVRGVKKSCFELFLFFEQFDPNPVTEEGKRRKARMEAKQQGKTLEGDDEEDIGKMVLPSFLPW
mmetsp:Transcript_9113/g.15100  ORF Transcript_9113/g.15100 Transcript_9113/m.15100 type:complete len:256 (-) Transcript_9113:151-918(-)